jgi:hypothetical protein
MAWFFDATIAMVHWLEAASPRAVAAAGPEKRLPASVLGPGPDGFADPLAQPDSGRRRARSFAVGGAGNT